jgi:hypothetical protein
VLRTLTTFAIPAALGLDRARSAAAGLSPRCCGFEASEPISFPGADSIFSSCCGAISGRPGDSVFCRQALPRRDPGDRSCGSARYSDPRNPVTRFLTIRNSSRNKSPPRATTSETTNLRDFIAPTLSTYGIEGRLRRLHSQSFQRGPECGRRRAARNFAPLSKGRRSPLSSFSRRSRVKT